MIDLAAHHWTARLLPEQGAAFASLAWHGHPVLAPLPAGAHPNTGMAGAFIMAPWANRLDHGHFGNHQLPMNRPEDSTAIHGISRDHPWRLVSQSHAAVVLAQHIAYPPFDYLARLELTLLEDGLTLALSLTNQSPNPVPFGLGWHPFFARPAGTQLRFAATQRLTPDARGLPIGATPSPGITNAAPDYDGLDHCFTGWDGTLTITRPDLTLQLHATGAWAQHLQVFAPTGANFLCAEPASHAPNAPNQPGAMPALAPGATLHAQLTLAAHLARG